MSSHIIEGEAPETDEEEDVKKVEIKAKKKVVHVDERVVQRWKLLTSDTATVVRRRSLPAQKLTQETKALAHSSFGSIQDAAASIRTASMCVNRIEDGLKDIKEATSLFPEVLVNTVDVLKIN